MTVKPLRAPELTPSILVGEGGVLVTRRFVFCVVSFVLFVFVLRLVCPVLQVSLDCPFSIATSVFSDVYVKKKNGYKSMYVRLC